MYYCVSMHIGSVAFPLVPHIVLRGSQALNIIIVRVFAIPGCLGISSINS